MTDTRKERYNCIRIERDVWNKLRVRCGKLSMSAYIATLMQAESIHESIHDEGLSIHDKSIHEGKGDASPKRNWISNLQ